MTKLNFNCILTIRGNIFHLIVLKIWSRPVFDIFSILNMNPDFLILEPPSFGSVVGHANQYTMKTLVRLPPKTCVLIKSTDNPDIFEQP